MNTDPRMPLSSIEAEVRDVLEQHFYLYGDKVCTCGVVLNSYTEADLHFSVAVYKAGYLEGFDDGYRDGRGEL